MIWYKIYHGLSGMERCGNHGLSAHEHSLFLHFPCIPHDIVKHRPQTFPVFATCSCQFCRRLFYQLRSGYFTFQMTPTLPI